MWEYTDTVKEHFLNPKNAGDMEHPDAVGEVGSLACGDALKLFLRIDDNGVIQDARFQTFGCASAIASSSVLTEIIKGKTVEEAKKITNRDIADYLGGLPKEKMHCSVMGQEALEAALLHYEGKEVPQEHPEGELVCKCFGVTEPQITKAVLENKLTTVEEVTNFTKAGGGCEECHERIEEIIAQALGRVKAEDLTPITPPKRMTNLQRMQLVTRIIDEEIRPSLQKDGGDIELVDIDGHTVFVSLRGACVGCPASGHTLKDFVEKRLKDTVEPDIVVQEVTA